ncbi:MAG TPA: hypothetical protein PKJ17_00780 [Syntrophorhabdaceae bacterium]|nr:hypothetical protein [Syntrophorhabdaceae bacterium]
MRTKLLLQVLIIIAAVAGCSGLEHAGQGPGDPSSAATAADMWNILDGAAASRPYSRYLYRMKRADGSEGESGVVSMAQGGNENMNLVVTGGELRIVPAESFRRSYDWETSASDRVPFGGGYAAGGRLAIIPGIYTPVDLYPSWFPTNAYVSVDEKCNLLVRMKKTYENETQRLVAFMDARSKLEGLTCEVLGTFHTVPQLKKLVITLRKEGKYNHERHCVLRLSWSSTYALVAISREGGRP